MALGEKLLETAATFTLRRLLSAAMSRSPTVAFGSPRQQANWGPGQPLNIAWWHVPVYIPFRFWWHADRIEHCQIFLHLQDGGEGIWMRWQSRDSPNGVSEIALLDGRVYMVPAVQRDERGDGSASITNETFFVDGRTKWAIVPGTTAWFMLEVRYGRKRQRCPYRYVVRVPPKGVSNGLFSLELDHPK